MRRSYTDRIKAARAIKKSAAKQPEQPRTPINSSLEASLVLLKQSFGEDGDLTIRQFEATGRNAAIISLENMVDKESLTESVLLPINRYKSDFTADEAMTYISQSVLATAEQEQCHYMEEIIEKLLSGFALFMLDGAASAIAIGAQGYAVRSISEPSGESVLRGSHEGFNESAKNNISMVRRRIKSADLRFESLNLGHITNTVVYICYLRSKVSDKMLDRIRRRLAAVDMDSVLESGYIQPYLECRPLSLFSTVGTTERPDTVCGKLMEGRAAIIVDGTPFALIVPHLFAESFQTIDDYTARPYYAFLIRLLKYISFFLTVFLSGLYVAIGTFHSEMLPDTLFYNITKAEMTTPMTLAEEAIIIHAIFEIVKEAGLRLPQPIGQAVSIVGGLVLGDTAVSSGFVGAPMIIVVALSAITSFVIPELAQPVVMLRFIGIIAAGYMGMFGVIIVLAVALTNLCALDSMGIPYLAPAIPYSKTLWQDVIFRLGWKRLSKRGETVENLSE